jgi:hypothetical protein
MGDAKYQRELIVFVLQQLEQAGVALNFRFAETRATVFHEIETNLGTNEVEPPLER